MKVLILKKSEENGSELETVARDSIQKGQRKLDKKWSFRWVQERVTPPERQNIGQILKANNMSEYDEFKLLVKNQGQSCQDECYIVEVAD